MANRFQSLLSYLRPQLQQSVTKADSRSAAVGVVPGRSTSLREDVMGQPHDSDYDLLYRIYDVNTDVSGAIDQWISVVTGNDWQVQVNPKYIRDAKDIPDDLTELADRISSWLENPNPDKGLKFDEIIDETIMDLAICGDAYWEVVRDKKGVPIEISNIHPSTMRVVADERGVVYGYIQRIRGKVTAKFEPQQVMHFRLPSRRNDLYGQSPLERAMEEISQDIKAMMANKSLMDNGFNPGAILLLNDGADNAESAKRIKEMIQQAHAGTSRWHRIMVGLGVRDIKPWGNTLKDMQFTDLRALATSKIATAFGVPKLFLNQKDAGDFATSDVLERNLYKTKGKKVQKLLNAMITEDLVQAFDDRLRFIFNPPDFSDTDALRKDAIELHKTNPEAITANELRTIHFGLHELDEAEEEDKDIPPKPDDEKSEDDPDTNPDQVEDDKKTTKHITKAKRDEEELDPLAIERDGQMADLEQALIEPLRDHFTEQEADYRNRLPDDLNESTLDTYLSATAQALDAALALVLGALVMTPFKAGIEAARQQLHAALSDDPKAKLKIDMTLRFDQVNPVVQDYIQTTAFEHVTGINETTRQYLRTTLAEGLRAGEGVPELSERIAAVFDKARDWRTDMIARTETAQAFHHGNHEAGRLLFEDGVVKYRKWLTAPDGPPRVCPLCLPLNGYTIRFDANYPDGVEPSHIHVQCRCTEVYLLGDEDELADWRKA